MSQSHKVPPADPNLRDRKFYGKELSDFIATYAQRTGYKFVKTRGVTRASAQESMTKTMLAPALEYYSVDWKCERHGDPEEETKMLRKRNRGRRNNCEAYINFRRSDDGTYLWSKDHNQQHNHDQWEWGAAEYRPQSVSSAAIIPTVAQRPALIPPIAQKSGHTSKSPSKRKAKASLSPPKRSKKLKKDTSQEITEDAEKTEDEARAEDQEEVKDHEKVVNQERTKDKEKTDDEEEAEDEEMTDANDTSNEGGVSPREKAKHRPEKSQCSQIRDPLSPLKQKGQKTLPGDKIATDKDKCKKTLRVEENIRTDIPDSEEYVRRKGKAHVSQKKKPSYERGADVESKNVAGRPEAEDEVEGMKLKDKGAQKYYERTDDAKRQWLMEALGKSVELSSLMTVAEVRIFTPSTLHDGLANDNLVNIRSIKRFFEDDAFAELTDMLLEKKKKKLFTCPSCLTAEKSVKGVVIPCHCCLRRYHRCCLLPMERPKRAQEWVCMKCLPR